jgi:hypothetical protein
MTGERAGLLRERQLRDACTTRRMSARTAQDDCLGAFVPSI